MNLVSITPAKKPEGAGAKGEKLLLVKLPYFTPWTPPLGIAILKSYLQERNYPVKCLDFNIDPELWGMHHKYFAALRELEDVSINDGYSKLWWILNGHMLARANGAGGQTCAEVLRAIIPLYGIRYTRHTIETLVALVERFFRRLDALTGQIDFSAYTMVGTSAYTTSLAASLFFLSAVKRIKPSVKTVMGGGVFADDLATGSDNLETLIREYPCVDHIVLGEGELLLSKILDGELASRRVVSIADVGGKTLDMKEAPMPDFSDLQNDLYHHLSIEGARSCPFQCSFCSETVQWGDYRKKPVELFADQVIELARRHHQNSFFMGDSLMNPYINSFAAELLRRGANILYDGYLRADKPVTNRKFVKTWADSGLFRARLGIESAAARVLDSMDKKTSPKTISDALKTLSGMGIRTTTYWIVGFPGESEEDFQETCEFIREHHRHIYELEAHPYYYYPYGQIGSRLYQSASLYPKEVTDIIKFQVWEIVNADPAREERYDRLRRISALAADLGLPNIYTMAERYEAEDRWLRLHPLAMEVYGRSQTERRRDGGTEGRRDGGGHREKAGDATHQAGQFAGDALAPGSDAGDWPAPTLCYRARVFKRLDANRLAEAMTALIEYDEALLMRLEDGGYSLTNPRDDWRKHQLVFVRQQEEIPDDRLFRQKLARSLSSEMRPRAGLSVRALLIVGEQDSCELWLLAHRAIADSRSLCLLFENLFRIYEQLDHNREISLAPPAVAYSEFVANQLDHGELVRADWQSPAMAKENRGNAESLVAPLGDSISKKLFGRSLLEFGLLPGEALVGALLRTLAMEISASEVLLGVTCDYRRARPELSQTVGVLTRVSRMPGAMASQGALLSDMAALRDALKDLFSRGATDPAPSNNSTGSSTGLSVLLNLDYLADEPWLGGDQWRPLEFLETEDGPRHSYDLEIILTRSGGTAELRLPHYTGRAAPEILDRIQTNLPLELEAILTQCERYTAAKQYWLDEFLTPPASVIGDLVVGEKHEAEPERAFLDWSMDKPAPKELARACQADISTVFLCAFGVVLSRLSGQEDMAMAVRLAAVRDVDAIPLRLKPYWSASFREFVQRTAEKISRSLIHSAPAFDILFKEYGRVESDRGLPIFDVAYVYGEDDRESPDKMDELIHHGGTNNGDLELGLQVMTAGEDIRLRLAYAKNKFTLSMIESMASYLNSIIDRGAKNANTPVADIALSRQERQQHGPAIAARDFSVENFQFHVDP